jgi:purine-binding chemotaxis protein CheW
MESNSFDSETGGNGKRDASEPAETLPEIADIHHELSDFHISSEEKKRILKERARRLARRPETEAIEEESVKVIEFTLAQERYAVQVEFVREVYTLRDLTPVPCAPSFVLGIINVRGQVISVLDLKEFFDLPRKQISDQSRVLILHGKDMEFGIVAESVLGERKIPVSRIQSDIPGIHSIRGDFIWGVTADRLVVIDVENMFTDKSIIVHQELTD